MNKYEKIKNNIIPHDKEILKLKRSYKYFKKINNLEKFNKKYPEGLFKLKFIGFTFPINQIYFLLL